MVLHFFRERVKDRIDFSDVIDVFFGELENCEITSDDDQVDIQLGGTLEMESGEIRIFE